MNYQQWQPLATAPVARVVAVNTGGYIFPGTFYRRPDNALYVVGPYGKIYEFAEIETWSWSETEPAAEMLMVKPHGIFCAHWWNEIGHLLNIIQDYEIKSFFELGISEGGLAALMLAEIRFGILDRYRGYNLGLDQVSYGVKEVIKRTERVDRWGARPADIYDIDLWQQTTVYMIRREIQNAEYPGKVFLYCDGGDKAREAALYWTTLRPGDLLGVHDYSDDPAAIGPEVYPADVEDILRTGKRRGQEALAETRILLVEKI